MGPTYMTNQMSHRYENIIFHLRSIKITISRMLKLIGKRRSLRTISWSAGLWKQKAHQYVLCNDEVLNRFDYDRLIIEDIRRRYLKLNDIDSKIIPLTSDEFRKV